MSLKKTEKIETNLYELEIHVDKATFDAAVDRMYKKNVKNISVPGFRKGKAPKSVVEKMYGKGAFYEDAINDLIPELYTEAVKEADLKVVSQPEFDVESIDEDGVIFKAKVYVKPEVKIEGYSGITADKVIVETTDVEIDEEIERIRQRNSRMIDIEDRAAQNDDTVDIDFDGYVDDVAFEGGKAEHHSLKLGSGQFIPGFEDQVIGKNIGDEFDVGVTFPAEYQAEELAGKPAVFKVKLNGIKFNELPELDDEFAKDVSEFDTLDEYKADIKAKITDRHSKNSDNDVEESLISTLIEKLVADIPDAMFVNETENSVRDYDGRLRMQGLDLSTYFKYTGLNLDALREQLRPQAERQVRVRLALEKIVELENIVASDEEVEEEYARLSEAYGMEIEKVKEMVEPSALCEDICVKKAVDFVKEKAVITEKSSAEVEAALEEVAEVKPKAAKKAKAPKADKVDKE